ncbi:kinesin, putative [Trypanosoma equiperdum]|uniref:Kinesin-like protein n=3 Tax=Trypanozoon TaxID=39700 RepID=D6XFK9_TRYB2|nr:kinesin, putative [Trypanosoma brucei brucei TREU927]AAX79863.1 kinesin, putative [Trypanosoma brucei]AAX80814.1 kinesin-like protein, putative [Trypanosoma brucei]AAZ10864.1 kinesin, putative [Trypanosoma brucei brucei TREU927]SCU65365.1 kinesin, putative [Trypanosoma equiperdum]
MTTLSLDSTAVRVVARCRPLLPSERNHTTSRIQINAEAGTITLAEKGLGVGRCFTFDRVFLPNAQQHDVAEEVSPLISHVLEGFCATIFAYGQTGSGKTHTVEGFEYIRNGRGGPKVNIDTDPEKHGIIPRVIQLIFDRVREKQFADANTSYHLKCSYYQIYNERVTDLLNPSSEASKGTGLKVRWCRDDTFTVENLYICECDQPGEMRRMFLSGAKAKEMGSHMMNQQSSRSHCVFTIHVERSDSDIPGNSVKSQLTIVDLAGSEKLTALDANPSSKLTKESIDINTSLFALGKVITSLAQRSKHNQKNGAGANQLHIPYRDSKLTKLLKHALGGNSLTTMLACISPSDNYAEETMSTLMFATTARTIKNVPYVAEDPVTQVVNQLRSELGNVKEELNYYQNLVGSNLINSGPTRPQPMYHVQASNDEAVNAQVNELSDKLLQACDALQKIMSINTQLRSAFDVVKEAKAELERREMELNAENLALRERIEMLESVVLKEDLTECFGNGAKSQEGYLKNNGYYYSSARASLLTNASDPKSCHAPTRPHSASVHESPAPTTAGQTNPRAYAADGAWAAERPPIAEDNPRPMTGPSVRPSAEGFVPSAQLAEERLRGEQSINKRREKLTKGLAEYANRYCQPDRFVNYAEYYGKARRLVTTNRSVSSTVDDMSKTLRQIPESIASTVPNSLKTTSQFGMLHFGGSREELGELEERRRQREEKRQALIAQQDALRGDVARAFVGITEKKEPIRAGKEPYEQGSLASTDTTGKQMPKLPSAQPAPADSVSRLKAYLEQEIGMRGEL